MSTEKPFCAEAQTGLEAWKKADMPAPPLTKGLKILGIIDPGAIISGASIGSGEWLLGPAAFVKYGLSLLWVMIIAIPRSFSFHHRREIWGSGSLDKLRIERIGRIKSIQSALFVFHQGCKSEPFDFIGEN